MKLDDFTDFLDELGIEHRISGESLVLKSCPSCGNENFKVHFFREREDEDRPFYGKCFVGKCDTSYSSIKYLLKLGVDKKRVLGLHGRDLDTAFKQMLNEEIPVLEKPVQRPVEKKRQSNLDLSKFFKISDWPDHQAALYANKRGVVPEFYDTVMIDHETNSVVFVVKDDGIVKGFQKRFIKPKNPKVKTRTSDGFVKSTAILQFPRMNADLAICEGPFTALSAWHMGYFGICVFGSGISEDQMAQIGELATILNKDIFVAFDSDEAGEKGFDKIRSWFYWKNISVKRLVPEIGNDLNDSWMAGKGAIEKDEEWAGPAVPKLSWSL